MHEISEFSNAVKRFSVYLEIFGSLVSIKIFLKKYFFCLTNKKKDFFLCYKFKNFNLKFFNLKFLFFNILFTTSN